ncbi:MAG: choice-of-anchor D domain-containing protein, partial [Terriglobales bacterium]
MSKSLRKYIGLWAVAGAAFCLSLTLAGCGGQASVMSTTAAAPPAASLSAAPTAVAFGDVEVGSQATQAVVLTNPSQVNVTVSELTMTGSGFGLANPPSTPFTLAAGTTASLAVVFAPQAVQDASGTLSVASDTTTGPVAVVLHGRGKPRPAKGPLTPVSASVSFGSVQVGQSATGSVVLTNTGTATVTISAATVTGAGFALGSGAPARPLAVAAGQSATLPVRFAPTTSGTASGTLSVGSDASNG